MSTIPITKDASSFAIVVDAFEYTTEESGRPTWVKRTVLINYTNRPDSWEIRESHIPLDGIGNRSSYNWSHGTEATARKQFEKIRSKDAAIFAAKGRGTSGS